MAKSEATIVKRKRKSNPIDSPPVKKFRRVEALEDEVQGGEGDYCQNRGRSVSLHREYEENLAELKKKLQQAKEEADFYFWKAEELDSRLQNLQHNTAQNQIAPSLTEGSGENDEEATSSECSTAQSGADKWTCSLCAKNKVCVAVVPCSHLCLCFDCAVDTNPEKCPVCDARQTDLFFVRMC